MKKSLLVSLIFVLLLGISFPVNAWAFKKHLRAAKKDPSLHNSKIYPPEFSLIYALCFGEGEKMKDLNLNFHGYPSAYPSHWMVWYPLLVHHENNAFDQTIGSALGGGAGSSGTGSFTPGGGGGGGAGGF